jgi:hypothetical protein
MVEGASSIAFTFLTGAVGVTVQGYPAAAVGPAIFFANTVVSVLSSLIYTTHLSPALDFISFHLWAFDRYLISLFCPFH